MNKLIIICLFCLITNALFSQEIEFCSSVNTSSEERLQSATGVGLQYQQNISEKYKVGLGVHYGYDNTHFVEDQYFDAFGYTNFALRIHSTTRRASVRLNIQRLLKDNEYVSLSLGPEISYNYLWGTDATIMGFDTIRKTEIVSFKKNSANTIGLGLISSVEIKDFIMQQLALCFTIRPEVLIGRPTALGGSSPIFSGTTGFVEFQIGLKYRFKKL